MKNRKFIIVLLIFIILLSIVEIILARYRTDLTANVNADIAFFVIESKNSQTLILDSLIPSDNSYIYNIAVSNQKDGITTKVPMEYVIKIRTTTNLPLDYSLYYKEDYEIKEDIKFIQDEDGVYYSEITFLKNEENSSILNEFGLEGKTHIYNLEIKFPSEYKENFEYADTIELVEITIDAKQIKE